ncbi:MAG: L,D-transpeptidase, partial [bacterium]|nr:L,D-transpeptidase [bacterium]
MNYILASLVIISVLALPTTTAIADSNPPDSDQDGLSDHTEVSIYKTNPTVSDTDADGYVDGEEVANNYDPNSKSDIKLKKTIAVSKATQTLSYNLGPYIIDSFKISTGVAKTPTPSGTFPILAKKPVNLYRSLDYN